MVAGKGKRMTENEALTLFKCLADKSRLRLVTSLSREDQYVERLAQLLGLTPATVSFHLKKLEEAGVVTARKEQYYTMYHLQPTPLITTLLSAIEADAGWADEQKRREADYRQRVLDSFMAYGKLKIIPAQRKKRRIILEELAKVFEPGRVYTEKEVNLTIADVHEDFCTLRRELINEGLMIRDRGLYRRYEG